MKPMVQSSNNMKYAEIRTKDAYLLRLAPTGAKGV